MITLKGGPKNWNVYEAEHTECDAPTRAFLLVSLMFKFSGDTEAEQNHQFGSFHTHTHTHKM